MQSTRNKLIHLLANAETSDHFISGQLLSEQLKISRSAIWKHMNELKKDGYEIEGKARKGYRIISFPNKLSKNTIQWGLNTKWLGKSIDHYQSIGSTQRVAHRAAIEGAEHGTVIIADKQTLAKGRMDRKWESAQDKGVWMSIILRPTLLPYQTPQLTLLTATVLADVIHNYVGIKPQIKWPNDILIRDKKMAGILTEMQAEQDQVRYVIIGMGLNVNHKTSDLSKDIVSKATSLTIETGKQWNILTLVQLILQTFEKKYSEYMLDGFPNVKSEWEKYGFKLNNKLMIETKATSWIGTFIGIAEDGALLAQHENGEIERIYSAEITWF